MSDDLVFHPRRTGRHLFKDWLIWQLQLRPTLATIVIPTHTYGQCCWVSINPLSQPDGEKGSLSLHFPPPAFLTLYILDGDLLLCMQLKTLKSPLDSKEIKPVHLKWNKLWLLFGRTDAEAEAPILWPPDVNSWFIGKDPDAGKDWRQKEKRATEDETVRWHHRHNGHGFGWTLGGGVGQGGLACCGSWGLKESDTTERLNWLTDFVFCF